MPNLNGSFLENNDRQLFKESEPPRNSYWERFCSEPGVDRCRATDQPFVLISHFSPVLYAF